MRLVTLAIVWSCAVVQSSRALDVDAAGEYSRLHGGTALIVEQRGRTLVQDFTTGGARERVYSITKNLWALAAFAMEKDGLLDFDERASLTLEEWRGSAKDAITLRQLVSMTSGLKPASARVYNAAGGFAEIALRQPLQFAPGRGFDYGAAPMEAFGEVMRRKLAARGLEPEAFLRGRVLAPNGIAASLKRGTDGRLMFSSGARMTAPDLLRLGRAVGRLTDRFFKGTRSNPNYGMTFWLNVNANSWFASETDIEEALDRWPPGSGRWRRACIAKAAPKDMITLLGSHGQRVYIVSSMDLIVVRTGNGGRFVDGEFWRRLMR